MKKAHIFYDCGCPCVLPAGGLYPDGAKNKDLVGRECGNGSQFVKQNILQKYYQLLKPFQCGFDAVLAPERMKYLKGPLKAITTMTRGHDFK